MPVFNSNFHGRFDIYSISMKGKNRLEWALIRSVIVMGRIFEIIILCQRFGVLFNNV